MLHNAEERYPKADKFAFALITASRRLKPYFLAHPIVVLTDQPLRQILHRPETSGRLVKWSVELGQYQIDYQPRPAIKGQALADFLVECAEFAAPPRPSPCWTLHIDGSSGRQGGGAGLVLTSPDGSEVEYAMRFDFTVTNNEAEYEALIVGLKIAAELEVRVLQVFSDSQLVVNQMNDSYATEKDAIVKYKELAEDLIKKFEKVEITQIPRSQNVKADELLKLTWAPSSELARTVFMERLQKSSLDATPEVLAVDLEAPTWMTPLIQYLTDGTLPADKDQARNLRVRAANFHLINGVLYKQLYQHPLARCLTE
ncbi:hypothetical protein Dimus_037963 [Dionaea muscipula]